MMSYSIETTPSQKYMQQDRRKQTLMALQSAEDGNVVAADKVHEWLRSWGEENEEDRASLLLKELHQR